MWLKQRSFLSLSSPPTYPPTPHPPESKFPAFMSVDNKQFAFVWAQYLQWYFSTQITLGNFDSTIPSNIKMKYLLVLCTCIGAGHCCILLLLVICVYFAALYTKSRNLRQATSLFQRVLNFLTDVLIFFTLQLYPMEDLSFCLPLFLLLWLGAGSSRNQRRLLPSIICGLVHT